MFPTQTVGRKELAPLPFSSDEAAIFPYKLVKDPDELKKIWRPDVFIDQAIDIRCCVVYINTSEKISFNLAHHRNPRYLIDTDSVRIYGNGTVSYAQRMNFDVTCSMAAIAKEKTR